MATWRDRVRRIADSGYSTLLMPDVPQWQPAPGPTLGLAAALADLRVGTWVYAAPLRPAWSTAWEAHSLSVLTDGRFEMGVGTGRPGIEDELSANWDCPWSHRASGWPRCVRLWRRCEISTAPTFTHP
jgi:alkanesulfonate monooxygenase SsuD/methylene tetrahydromethanopterin reductase-like flavin-dependent oxidoreductase (luciferase family)